MTAKRMETPSPAIPLSQKIARGDVMAAACPSLFIFVSITLPGVTGAAPNHSPRFQVDEAGMITGLRATLHVAADYTGSGTPA